MQGVQLRRNMQCRSDDKARLAAADNGKGIK